MVRISFSGDTSQDSRGEELDRIWYIIAYIATRAEMNRMEGK
tara:strand:- start:58 stop:183 length:126 start_codon:yes stop_codon:yes gene_type:complete